MKSKRTSFLEDPKIRKISNLVFAIFLGILTISYIVLFVVGLLNGSIEGSWAMIFSVLTGLFLLSSYAMVSFESGRVKKTTSVRFNPKDFSSIKNAKS